MSEYNDTELYDSTKPYSEFNTSFGYNGYLRDLDAQHQSGIICSTLVRKATRQGLGYDFAPYD